MKTSPSIDVLRSYSKSPRIGKMVFLSMALHIMMISAMFYLPNLASTRTFYSPVYSVRLVNIPPSLGPVRESAPNRSAETLPSVPPPPSPVVEKPKVKDQAKPISLSPTEKEEAEKKVADAIERIRQRRESKSIDSAIERIRDEKEARQVSSAIEGIRKRVTIGSSGAVETGEAGTGGASSGIMSIKFKIYYNLIWQRIRSVWVLPEGVLGGKKNLETIITIRIAKDGQIEDIQFEKKSGNPYLDESALRAIKKANPLPPLPSGMEGDKFDVGVRFAPSDL
ncbi:MAG: cell envelope integrity protein TolA [Deltaproteobacteria bacterium]|nr:cell envelope integrity protein TolA [Deltaproteobacteria bacterium]